MRRKPGRKGCNQSLSVDPRITVSEPSNLIRSKEMPQKFAALVRIDKDLRRAKHRRALRTAFLQRLSVGPDEDQIDRLLSKYFECAKSSGKTAATDTGDRYLGHEFLADATALYLIASEPYSR